VSPSQAGVRREIEEELRIEKEVEITEIRQKMQVKDQLIEKMAQ